MLRLPFGMMMPGREYQAQPSRFGFNGKENDNEVKGFGNQQDYGMRIYDGRIGKFLSVDPISKSYPQLTPYQFASNRPIDGIDMDGLEWEINRATRHLEQRAAMIKPARRDHGTISAWDPKNRRWTQKWRDSDNFFANVSYDIANGLYTLPQQLTASIRNDDYISNIGGNVHRAHGIEGEKQRMKNFVNGATVLVPGAPATKLEGVIAKYTDDILVKIESEITQQLPKLSQLETKIVNEANSIINSKQFEIIQNAYRTGSEASVQIGEKIINYSPETAGSAITMHPTPFHSGSGFQLGPQAFKSQTELNKTLIQELYRLSTQSSGMIDVDLARPFTDAAFGAAEKLHRFVLRK